MISYWYEHDRRAGIQRLVFAVPMDGDLTPLGELCTRLSSSLGWVVKLESLPDFAGLGEPISVQLGSLDDDSPQVHGFLPFPEASLAFQWLESPSVWKKFADDVAMVAQSTYACHEYLADNGSEYDVEPQVSRGEFVLQSMAEQALPPFFELTARCPVCRYQLGGLDGCPKCGTSRRVASETMAPFPYISSLTRTSGGTQIAATIHRSPSEGRGLFSRSRDPVVGRILGDRAPRHPTRLVRASINLDDNAFEAQFHGLSATISHGGQPIVRCTLREVPDGFTLQEPRGLLLPGESGTWEDRVGTIVQTTFRRISFSTGAIIVRTPPGIFGRSTRVPARHEPIARELCLCSLVLQLMSEFRLHDNTI